MKRITALCLIACVVAALLAGCNNKQSQQGAAGTKLLVLQDAHLPLPADVQRHLGEQGARVMALEADPVRMWRGQHASLLCAPTTRLLGVTTWPKFLMVRGLAEESGRRLREHPWGRPPRPDGPQLPD